MAVLDGADRSLLVHEPQINGIIGVRACNEVLGVDHVQRISEMLRVPVQQLRVFVHFPEDDLPIKATSHHSVTGVLIDVEHLS